MSSQPQLTLTQIARDWTHPLRASNFTGYIPDVGERDPAGSVLRCITMTRVPCSQEVAIQNGIGRIVLAVVRVVKKGWVNAPYKKPKANNGKAPVAAAKSEKDPNAKPLFEEVYLEGQDFPSLKVYNYNRTSAPSDKGPRVDDCFCVISPGMTLTFSMKSEFVFKENTFPKDTDIIQPYTMVDLVIAPASVEQARSGDKGGYGIKLVKVRVHDSSVYSYANDYQHIFRRCPMSAQDRVASTLRDPIYFSNVYPPSDENPVGTLGVCVGETIRNCLENKAPMYYIPAHEVDSDAFITSIRPDLDYFRIQTGAAGTVAPMIPTVDVHIQTMLRLLNTADEVYAKTLMDFALAANAVSFLATTDEWFSKNESALATTRVIPLIDVSRLFADVDSTKFDLGLKYVDFPVSFKPPPSVRSLAISVPMAVVAVSKGVLPQPPTTDFILVGPDVKLERAYEVQFVEGDDALLTTFLNTKAGKSPGGTEPGVQTVYVRTSRKREARVEQELPYN